MSSKYDSLSGTTILTVTPFGLLDDLLTTGNTKIYLIKSTNEYSLDLTFWSTLNKGLAERIIKYEYPNITIFNTSKDMLDYKKEKLCQH